MSQSHWDAFGRFRAHTAQALDADDRYVQAQHETWRDLETQPWGDADRVLVTGTGPMYFNVLESEDAYYVVGEYDPVDCDHVEVRLSAHTCNVLRRNSSGWHRKRLQLLCWPC